jgi:glycosyltransferase involved in cell wall biosynthesis
MVGPDPPGADSIAPTVTRTCAPIGSKKRSERARLAAVGSAGQFGGCERIPDNFNAMRISIITAAKNAQATIASTLASVAAQEYPDVEHVLVDGLSTDATLAIARRQHRPGAVIVTGRDTGIYDAFNKGLKLAGGEVIGYLNADDFYASARVLSRVADEFRRTGVDAVFGDAAFVRPTDLSTYVRRYRSAAFRPALVRWGLMPAHSALFIRRQLFDRFGDFDPSFEIAGDFELVVRFFKRHSASYRHIPAVLTVMRTGGASTRGLASTQTISREIVRACRQNGEYTNRLMVLSRYLWKLRETIGAGQPEPIASAGALGVHGATGP